MARPRRSDDKDPTPNPMQDKLSRRTGRRGLMTLGAAAAAGAIAGAILTEDTRKAEAHPIGGHFESANPDPAVHGNNTDSGPGVEGNSVGGPGLRGVSTNNIGVTGESVNSVGVWGVSQNNTAVVGHTQSGIGVNGASNSGDGVRGESPASGTGVRGRSDSGNGVHGESQTGIAILATSGSPNHPALIGQWNAPQGTPAHTGVLGTSNLAHGVHGFSPAAGGVFGEGLGEGVRGKAVLNGVSGGPPGSGTGVIGESGSGTGVRGTSQSGDGVRGESQSGHGVRATSVTGAAIDGSTPSPDNAAVVGRWTGPANSPTPHSGISGSSTGNAPGVHGTSPQLGVLGDSVAGTGVRGTSTSGAGVNGTSTTSHGVRGTSIDGTGVFGTHTSAAVGGTAVSGQNTGFGPGVTGRAVNGSSVFGFKEAADIGPGLNGLAPGDNPGVLAQSGYRTGPGGSNALDDGLALEVVGKSQFSTAGLGTIPNNAKTHTVSHAAVLAASIVLVTLLADAGAVVEYVSRLAGSFTVHLSKEAKQATEFGYFILN